jgi:thiol-disulfide isomerase/thioredoxin
MPCAHLLWALGAAIALLLPAGDEGQAKDAAAVPLTPLKSIDTAPPKVTPAAEADPPAAPSPRKPIYDDKADARAQIAAATQIARRDNKRVLVVFGGNWCSWCYKLDDLFENDPSVAPLLRSEYQVVLVDSNENLDLFRGYGADQGKHGFPFLTVLDVDGTVLTNQNTGDLEDGPRHDPAKVKAFLEQWKPELPSAEDAWRQALERARHEDKSLLVYASAPWCGWCHRLADRLEELNPLLSRDYVVLKIDTERMKQGSEVIARWRNEHSQGIPWMAIVSPAGRLLITSDAPAGNVGCPAAPEEIQHFLAMLEATKRKLTDEELRQVADTLARPR